MNRTCVIWLLRNSGNKHQNNRLICTETIRHSSTQGRIQDLKLEMAQMDWIWKFEKHWGINEFKIRCSIYKFQIWYKSNTLFYNIVYEQVHTDITRWLRSKKNCSVNVVLWTWWVFCNLHFQTDKISHLQITANGQWPIWFIWFLREYDSQDIVYDRGHWHFYYVFFYK